MPGARRPLLWGAAFILALPLTLADVRTGTETSVDVHFTAQLQESVAMQAVVAPRGLQLASTGSNVNVLATLHGPGYARAAGSPAWAPLELSFTDAFLRAPLLPLRWSDGRLADSTDPLVVARADCHDGAPHEVLALIRSDTAEFALLGSGGWDRAKVADGRLGDELLDQDHAKDVTVSLCGASYAVARLVVAGQASAHVVFAVPFAWTADGTTRSVDLEGPAPQIEWTSWGPHDFVPGTPDDPT